VNAASWVFLLTGVLLNAAAQLLLQGGHQTPWAISSSARRISSPVGMKLAFEPHIRGGLACYVVSVAAWIVGLSRVEVSIAIRCFRSGTSWNALAAWYLFGESLTAQKFIGIAFIVAGVFLVARS